MVSSFASCTERNSDYLEILFWDILSTWTHISTFNLDYFSKREKKKNALAISSKQSNEISSYEEVLKNYENTLKRDNLGECPEYWGGYSFIPYYFEFWEGHKSRINKREVYEIKDNKWINYFLQP